MKSKKVRQQLVDTYLKENYPDLFQDNDNLSKGLDLTKKLYELPIWCENNKAYLNNQKNECCLLHITATPLDPITKEKIPFSDEQITFAKRALNFLNKKQMIKELSVALNKRNETERRKEIKKIAVSILPDLEDDYLPQLPKDRIEWEYHCRQFIKGMPNRLKYLPMMLDIIKDNHPFQMYLLARQWGKTVMIGNDLAFNATTKYDYDQTYFNFKLDALRTFSENKFRQDTFGTGPLSHYISGSSKLGAMNRVITKTRSIVDMLLPGVDWQNSQGKSNRKMFVDEGQDHNWTGFQNARETQADTFGDLIISGIGGYVDTDYHRIWDSTNQMEYFFDDGDIYKGYENMSWRKNLQYDENGLIYDDYMTDVLSGKYKPQKPDNESRHGYHLSQVHNPRIPLTIDDAINKYKISPEFSIEWKEKKDPNYVQIDFRRNVLAEFVEGELKPITTQDMLKLFDKTVHLTKVDDVDFTLGPVIIGIDWGGGGKTVIWIWQCINEEAPIFKLLWVEKVETNDTKEQEQICIELIDGYQGDFIQIDAGGAPDRVQTIQKRYGNRSSRTTYSKRPELPLPTKKEYRKQKKELRFVIDRTFSINRIINLIKQPYTQGDLIINRIILPGADYEKTKWIIPQFVAIEGVKSDLKSTGQKFIEYTHKDSEPDDALHACNYAFIGWDNYRNKNKNHYSANIGYNNTNTLSIVDDII